MSQAERKIRQREVQRTVSAKIRRTPVRDRAALDSYEEGYIMTFHSSPYIHLSTSHHVLLKGHTVGTTKTLTEKMGKAMKEKEVESRGKRGVRGFYEGRWIKGGGFHEMVS